MNMRAKITMRRRVVVIGEDEKAPFWLEHLLALIFIGVGGFIVGAVLLALTDWGRATLVWIGLGFGVVMTVWLAVEPFRSFRAGERVSVWVGEALSAFGWGAMTISLAAGIPFVFWIGPDHAPEWAFFLPGAGCVVFTAIAALGMFLQTRGPLPALDRTPRTARVLFNSDDADGGQSITVRYRGVDGDKHDAELADLIDDSWRDRFAPGTTWQVYAFREANLADSVVFLTEEHEDVWRDGYKLNGVRLGGEGGPVTPGPGSPFLREGGKWKFEP